MSVRGRLTGYTPSVTTPPAQPPRGPRPPWYEGGLRFECQPDCGRCCSRHDDYAYVYLEGDDLPRLAKHLGLSGAEFRKAWTRRDDGYTVLAIEGDACPFLDGARCTVYDARPVQCRTFPFWRENLRTRDRWESLVEFCPGVGRGDFVPLESIRAQARARKIE